MRFPASLSLITSSLIRRNVLGDAVAGSLSQGIAPRIAWRSPAHPRPVTALVSW